MESDRRGGEDYQIMQLFGMPYFPAFNPLLFVAVLLTHHRSLTNSERLKCCSLYALWASLDGR